MTATEPPVPTAPAPEPRTIRPGEEGWDAARQAWNLTADQHPAAVAFAASPEELADAVRAARDGGLRLSAQATGHGAATLGDLADTVLVKTVRMSGVEIDPERRRARVEAGALWGDVVVAAAEHGLAALHGSSATVGVVGYTLGGGIGWLGRRHGLACNWVTALELVTADGAIRRVDAESEPDLFWAVRGGGGAFGLVSAIEFELLPLREAFAGMIVWPADRGPEVLDAWREWTGSVPEEMTSSFRWLALPPLPEVPEPLRGKATVAVTAAHCGDPAEAAELLAPLREIPGATMDAFGSMPAAELRNLNGDPEAPSPTLADQALLSGLDADAAAALCEVAGPPDGGRLSIVELRHLGGALAREADGGGALTRLDGEFALLGLGLPMDPAMVPALRAGLDELVEAARPWRSGSYLNFADTPVPSEEGFGTRAWRRLREIKAAIDPEDAIRSNRPIEPA